MMLDAHPDLAIPGETHFLAELMCEGMPNEGLSRAEFLRVVTTAPTWPNLGLEAQELSACVGAIDPFTLADGVRCFYRLYATAHNKRRWGDKTTTYRVSMPGIAAMLPEAHFIHMIRDGRDVALSYRGLWFGPGDDIDVQARFWVDQISLARSHAKRLSRYLEVKYEDLIADPEAQLQRACRFLRLPYDSQMLSYHRFANERLAEHTTPFGPPGTPESIDVFLGIFKRATQPLDPGRVGRWRTEMSGDDQQRYEATAGALLKELGYKT